MSDGESESEAGFENMAAEKSRDGNIPEEGNETDNGQQSTRQPSDEEDGTIADEKPSSPQTKTGEGTSDQRGKASAGPPPRRELPFTRTTRGKKNTETQPPGAENDVADTAGETDDDEL